MLRALCLPIDLAVVAGRNNPLSSTARNRGTAITYLRPQSIQSRLFTKPSFASQSESLSYRTSLRRRPQTFKSSQQTRHCSNHRNMCKHFDAVPSTIDVFGREVLPKNVKPVHYDLTLEPDFEKFTYEGEVAIE